jgi:hypothetical protein
MAKYDGLQNHLALLGTARVTMSFSEIEGLVGVLPRTARGHRAWWANDPGGGSRVRANAWRGAGYTVESVNLASGVVVFTRSGTR